MSNGRHSKFLFNMELAWGILEQRKAGHADIAGLQAK